MEFNQNLKALRKQSNLTQLALAEKLGVAKSTYSLYESGKRQPDVHKIKKICKILGIDGSELLGLLETETSSNPKVNTKEENQLIKKYRTLDEFGKETVNIVIDRIIEVERNRIAVNPIEEQIETIHYMEYYDLPVSAGTGVFLSDEYKDKLAVPRTPTTLNADFCLRISGDSMEPKYSHDDLVFIKKQSIIEVGEVGIFALNGEGYIKKLGNNELISLNKKYPYIEFTGDDTIKCLGIVIGKM